MSRLRLLLGLIVAAPAAAGAQSTGVASCDAFLDAYAQCVASPGVPAAVRPSMTQGIEQMRSSFRDAATNSDARKVLPAQCVQTHTSVRQSMVQSFKCDFPAAVGTSADAAPPADPAPRRPGRTAAAPSAEEQEVAKANAWVKGQNYIVQWHNLGKELADYQEVYGRNTPKPGAKIGDAAYYFNIGELDNLIETLQKAADMPGAVPGVDEAGAKLIQALEQINPVIKRMRRYRDTREYVEDSFKLAREQHPVILAGMRAASNAQDLFGNALSERELARDEKRIATLPTGSLPRMLLQTSLDARRVTAQHDLLTPRANTAPLLAAVAALSSSTNALHAKLDGMRPKPDTHCLSYAKHMDTMIGDGRGLARDIKAGSDPGSASRSLIETYNRSVDDLASCQERMEGKD